MNRNLRTIITDKDNCFEDEIIETGEKFKFVFRPFFDLVNGESIIKSRILPNGNIKYYIKTSHSFKGTGYGRIGFLCFNKEGKSEFVELRRDKLDGK